MMKRLLLIGLLLTAVLYTEAQQFKKIEKLAYTGYYNWGIIWMRAGLVEFNVRNSAKYPNSTYIEAVGSSLPSWDWVFRLRDTLTVHFDKNNFQTHESSRKAHEGNYHKTFDYRWDHAANQVLARIERIGRYVRNDTIQLKPNTFDMLSVAWKVREMDYDKYSPGDQIPIRLLIDDEIFDIYVRYHGVETIKFEKKKIDCYVLSPMLVEGEVFKKGENMKIWVSKDAYRLPLIVEAKILVGSVKGILNTAESIYE